MSCGSNCRQRAVARPVSVATLHKALPHVQAQQIAVWLDRRSLGQGNLAQGNPVNRAASVLETMLVEIPHAETEALILADAALAQALGWDHVVPLLAAHLKVRDLRKTGDDLRLACHKSLVASVRTAAQMAADLARRAAQMQAIAPKLRAKGAAGAVDMFLSRDAVLPTALPLSDRGARRLCDRLVQLGVARELTGRDTFRLYGI